jgi:hypothetical protein
MPGVNLLVDAITWFHFNGNQVFLWADTAQQPFRHKHAPKTGIFAYCFRLRKSVELT